MGIRSCQLGTTAAGAVGRRIATGSETAVISRDALDQFLGAGQRAMHRRGVIDLNRLPADLQAIGEEAAT